MRLGFLDDFRRAIARQKKLTFFHEKVFLGRANRGGDQRSGASSCHQRDPPLIRAGQLTCARVIVCGINPQGGRARHIHDGVIEHANTGKIRGNVFSILGIEQGNIRGNFRGAQQSQQQHSLVLAVAVALF
jgi:hypothetical protein